MSDFIIIIMVVRVAQVLLIVRVAQVPYWRHYYDYDLTLASINHAFGFLIWVLPKRTPPR